MSEHAAREKREANDKTGRRTVRLSFASRIHTVLAIDGQEQADGAFALKLIAQRAEIDVVPLQKRIEIIERLRKVENGVYE